ncbi:MAG: hypothetical protein IJU20_03555 [Clostridia bacterium]|nr:hypothetical protein [Clostridia bacterium]
MSKKRTRGRTSWLRLFYYSHPYLVIFNALILYNIVLLAIAAWAMTWLMANPPSGEPLMEYTFQSFLKNLQYCTVFTMNNGGIYNDAPDTVVALKIVLSIVQMITFTGSLIGLATSMLQGVFDRRAHNVGRLKLKNHYVILNWSPAGANLVRELSFLPGRKVVVILSEESRDEINEQIDNLFLETATGRKNLSVFVKQGKPGSRKALKEISVKRAKSIALLVPANQTASEATDVDTFKLLMGIIGITKSASIAIEAVNEDTVNDIEEMVKASPELSDLKLTTFTKGGVVGHILARSAINSSYSDLYYSLMTYQNGGFYEIPARTDLEGTMGYYNNCIPVAHYKEAGDDMVYALASRPSGVCRSPGRKVYNTTVPYRKKFNANSFILFVIGQNSRSEAIVEEARAYTESKQGRIECRVYPFDVDTDALLDELNTSTRRRKKILILSDETAGADHVDVNVFVTLLNLKASHRLPANVEISAELLDQSNRSSLAALNVTSVIISNRMVALYLVQLMTHPDHTSFYQGMLSSKTDYSKPDLDVDIRYAEELFDLSSPLTFTCRGEFISAVYKSSGHEYIPIGFVGEKGKDSLVGSVTSAVTKAVGKTIDSVVDITKKAITTITDMETALNMEEIDDEVEAQLDSNSKIILLCDRLSRKEKITLEKGMILVLIHYPAD